MKTSEKYWENINNLDFDDFGRPSGLLLIDKPINISSHDVVDQVRNLLKFRQVGHGGALDIFASGLEIVLVGKATKMSEDLLLLDKAYNATVLFGVATETQDLEGKIMKIVDSELKIDQLSIEKVLKSFDGEQEQFVSPFSSVKVKGNKLRKILRDASYSYKIEDTADGKRLLSMTCTNKPDNNYVLEIPKRKIKLSEIKLLKYGYKKPEDITIKGMEITFPLPYCEFSVRCTKGTYIRQLAEDIGKRLNIPATLIQLDRTSIGGWTKLQALTINQLENQLKAKLNPEKSGDL